MDWIQTFAIIGSTGGFILWAFSKLDADMKSLSNDTKAQIQALSNRMDVQSQRTDQLYQMFIDLLKEKK